MACFRQILATIIEDGGTPVTAEFVISDDYSELFSQTGVVDIDILDFGSSKKDLDTKGVQKEDEFDFTMSAAKINLTDFPGGQDAFDFILTADSADLWCALFIYETDTFTHGDIDYMEFSGKIRQKATFKNLCEYDVEYGSNPTPLREWKESAQAWGAAVLDTINMTDETVDTVFTEGLLTTLKNETSWVASNVSDRTMREITAAALYVKNLVNLNEVMFKLRELAEARIQLTIPAFELTYAATTSTMTFIPGQVADFYNTIEARPDLKKRFALLASNYLDSPYVNWNKFEPGYGYSKTAGPDDSPSEYDTKDSEDEQYSFKTCKTFTDFLYQVALCFGCYVKFENLAGTHLQISFIPRSGVEEDEVFIRDFTAGDGDIQAVAPTGDKKYKGLANRYAVEGVDYYTLSITGEVVESVKRATDKSTGDLLQLAIAPTFCDLKQKQLQLPHNSEWWTGSTLHLLLSSPRSIHNAIYSCNAVSLGVAFWGPVVEARIKIGNDEQGFSTLAGCLNALLGIDGKYYETSYKKEIPYLTGFSLNADGSNPSWKNLKIGSKYTEDGREYIVMGIERKPKECKTVIRLERISKFGFTDPEGVLSIIFTPPGTSTTLNGRVGLAGEDILKGDICFVSEGTLYLLQAYHTFLNYIPVVALNDASEGDMIDYSEGPEVDIDTYNLIPGKKVVCRYVDYGVNNLSQEALNDKNNTEDLHIQIGVALSETRIRFDVSKFVFWPMAERIAL